MPVFANLYARENVCFDRRGHCAHGRSDVGDVQGCGGTMTRQEIESQIEQALLGDASRLELWRRTKEMMADIKEDKAVAFLRGILKGIEEKK